MIVKLKVLDENAKVPVKKYSRDFCYDVFATSKKEVHPGVIEYGIGLAFQLMVPDDMKDFIFDIDFRPRSSVWKTGLSLCNCEGTIDELYRGEVTAKFYHIVKELLPYEVGDRIGQIKIGMTIPAEFVVVDELNETERGINGYGSTGRRDLA